MTQSPISTILNFANSIDLSSPTLIPDLRTKIPFFPAENIQSKHRNVFENKGTDLWNLATRLNRNIHDDDKSNDEQTTKIALLRVFAFGMLDSAASSRTKMAKQEQTCVRMVKVAFKCIKACVDAGELDFASKVASRAAGWLSEGEEVLQDHLRKKLGGEYFVWRMALVSPWLNRSYSQQADEEIQGMEPRQARCRRAHVREVPESIKR